MIDGEIDVMKKVCMLDQRLESLDHPVYENTQRKSHTSKSLRFSDLGGGAADLQKRQNFGFQILRSRYINETRSEAIFSLRRGPPSGPPPKSKNLKDFDM